MDVPGRVCWAPATTTVVRGDSLLMPIACMLLCVVHGSRPPPPGKGRARARPTKEAAAAYRSATTRRLPRKKGPKKEYQVGPNFDLFKVKYYVLLEMTFFPIPF